MELRKILYIFECSKVSYKDVEERMTCDFSDPGFQILSDDELVESQLKE